DWGCIIFRASSLARRRFPAKNGNPVRAEDDDAPFSNEVLEWLEEGDRLGDGPASGAIRPSGQYVTTESHSRRARFIVGGVVVLAVGFVFVLRLSAGGKPKGEQAAVPTAPATIAETPPPVAEPAPAAARVAVIEPPAAV